MRRVLTTEQESLKQSLKLFIANIGLSQSNWKTSTAWGLHHHHHDTKRSAEASRRCDRSPEQSMSSASSRASVAVTPVSQQIWWTQVVLGPAAAKHNVTELAVGPSDVACQWFGQTQPTSSLITDEVTVRGQLRWPHAGQRAVG